MKFEISKSLKKKNIDLYIFTVCELNQLKIKKKLLETLNIKKIPQSLFKQKKDELFKKLYFDTFEIIFIYLPKKCNQEELYKSFSMLGKYLNDYKGNIFIYLDQKNQSIIKSQIISFITGIHQTLLFKSNHPEINSIIYFYHIHKNIEKQMHEYLYIGKTINHIRDLNNSPGNILNNDSYEKVIKQNLEKDVKIEVLNEDKLKKLGLNLILSVNQGSKYKAKMIILTYKHLSKTSKNEKPIVFVGKGVMFDTGGSNLKTGDYSDMKTDMTGSSTVYGLFNLMAYHKTPGYFIGLLPIVENRIGSNATLPGDIVTSYNKKTVEIIDTDAEGRLIMADALAFSEKYKPKLCIDISTLTGVNEYFFGGKGSSIMGNNNQMIQKMIQCGKENHEHLWEIPMWSEYIENTKSNLADLRNYSPEAKAGTIMAGAFLSHFIPKESKWIHIDIAGADSESESQYRSGGSNGVLLKTLFCFISHKTN